MKSTITVIPEATIDSFTDEADQLSERRLYQADHRCLIRMKEFLGDQSKKDYGFLPQPSLKSCGLRVVGEFELHS